MIRLTVNEVARITQGQLFSEDGSAVVGGLSVDTRTLEPGQFFAAIKGANFDGHDFTDAAAEKGAAGLIVERSADPFRRKAAHVVVVEDVREALGLIAAEIRKRVNIPVIGVTGTNGKTTVKDILAGVLSSRYRVLHSKGSYNNIIGLSLTLFGLDASYDIAVLEMGSNHPGEIAKLAEISGPQTAVITNIGDGHLKNFSTRENILLEKTSILDFLPTGGAAFLNGDDPLLAGADVPSGAVKKFYGMSSGCDPRITGLSRKMDGYDFSLNGRRFFFPAEGVHNVYNAAAAAAVAEYYGLSQEDIRCALAEVSLPEMRLEKVDTGGLVFINDSYNANPGSFMCALDVLQDSAHEKKRAVVAGDMLELGDSSEEFHRMVGESIARRKVDFLVVLGGRAGDIALGAIESGMGKERVLTAASHEDAAEIVRRMAGPGTVVLLKGSREAKMEEVIRCFTTSCIP